MTNLPDLPKSGVFAGLAKAKSEADKAKVLTLAGQYVTNQNFKEPVPAFFTELPFGGDNDEITDRIALQVLASDDPDKLPEGGGSVAFRDLAGKEITVWDIRAMAGGLDRGWKAYLLMDITVGDSEIHQVANTGAKQVVTRLARAWAEGHIPIKGRVTEISTAGGGGNKPLAFITEPKF